MKPTTFLSLYEKLEKLAHRLPESLQQPILREITPIKTLFLLQRAPRLVLLGHSGSGKVELVNSLFSAEAMQPGEDHLNDGAWAEIDRPGRGRLRVLDARRPASLNMLRAALTSERPDLFLFLHRPGGSEVELAADLDHAQEILRCAETADEARSRLLGVVRAQSSGDPEVARQDLNAALHSRQFLSDRMVGATTLVAGGDRLAELIALELPGEAQLEMARLSGNRVLQKQIAQVLIKSMTAICAAIGTQPIPLADFPILASLQATMVAGIMHIAGREWSPKLAGEFMATLGANIGVGFALREGARAAAKFVPLWGNAISGAVAGAGTYTMGRAATAYFIEGVSLDIARGIFRRKKREKPLLKD